MQKALERLTRQQQFQRLTARARQIQQALAH
jgi:hypothetical protein